MEFENDKRIIAFNRGSANTELEEGDMQYYSWFMLGRSYRDAHSAKERYSQKLANIEAVLLSVDLYGNGVAEDLKCALLAIIRG